MKKLSYNPLTQFAKAEQEFIEILEGVKGYLDVADEHGIKVSPPLVDKLNTILITSGKALEKTLKLIQKDILVNASKNKF